MRERLQKIIAQAGLSSRRGAEELIEAGRVRVNGRVVTELGAQADTRQDKVEVDGKRLVAESPVYLVFHKPKNVVSTLSDPEGRPTVAEYFKEAGARVFPVGRLDFATSGILLATNDGEFSNALLHPKKDVPKTYIVKARGAMSNEDLDRWRKGVDLEDGRTLPAQARLLRHEGDKTWFEITIREGRNQQIRRMGEATGFFVMRLARTTFAGIGHEGLRPGQWRPLTVAELKVLKASYDVPKKIPRDVPRGAAAASRVASAAPARGTTPMRGTRGSARRGEDTPRWDGARKDSPRAGGREDREEVPTTRGRAPRVDARGANPRSRPGPRDDARADAPRPRGARPEQPVRGHRVERRGFDETAAPQRPERGRGPKREPNEDTRPERGRGRRAGPAASPARGARPVQPAGGRRGEKRGLDEKAATQRPERARGPRREQSEDARPEGRRGGGAPSAGRPEGPPPWANKGRGAKRR